LVEAQKNRPNASATPPKYRASPTSQKRLKHHLNSRKNRRISAGCSCPIAYGSTRWNANAAGNSVTMPTLSSRKTSCSISRSPTSESFDITTLVRLVASLTPVPPGSSAQR
jgi:hypothetical protein